MAREYINKEDMLNTGREKLNKSIDRSYDASETSTQAIAVAKVNEEISKESNMIAKDTNDRMNQIIGGETNSAEIIDARTPLGLESSKTLNERLNLQFGNNDDFRPEDKSLILKMKNEFEVTGINPTWYGALPDSGIPSQDAFNKAFEKSNILRVTQGIYTITGTINLPDNAKIFCQGKVVFDGDLGSRIFYGNGKTGITLLDFEMTEKGNVTSSGNQDGSKGIYLNDCKDCLIQSVKGTGFGAWGIIAVGCERIVINMCEGHNSVRQSGIGVSNCTDYTVSSCICENNHYSGIISEPAGSNGRILDNFCRKNEHGILVKDDGEGTVVSRNNVSHNTDYGIYTELTEDVLFSDNISKYNGRDDKTNVGFGFYGKNTTSVSVINNDIQSNNAHAIYYMNGEDFVTDEPTIKGNLIKRNCLTYTADNQAEVYMSKSTNIILGDNFIDPTGRAYVITDGSTFIGFDQKIINTLASSKKNYAELVPFARNLQKLTLTFNSSNRNIVFSKSFDMRVVWIEASCMVSVDSSIELKINGIARLVVNAKGTAREYSNNSRYPANFSRGEDINLLIANTINNSYISYYKLDIYYF